MSFSLGLVHIGLAIAGVLIGIRALNRTRRVDALLFAGAALAGAFLATEWSSPIWARVTTLQYFQFPWRALCVPALFMPLLALYVFERLAPRASLAVILLLVLVNLPRTQPKGYLTFDDGYYSPASIAAMGVESALGHFEPRWVQSQVRYTGNGILLPTPLTSVRALSWTSTRHVYSVVSPGLVRAMDSTNYYPGWTVLIDGRETAVSPAPVFGTISFEVPPGQHTITVELRSTPVRRLGLMITLATLAALLSIFAARHFGWTRSFSRISSGAAQSARGA